MSFLNWITGALGYTAILGALGLAVAAHFFAPRAWSALAWTAAFVLLGAAFVGQREVTAGVEVKLARAEAAKDQLTAEYATAMADANDAALQHERELASLEQTLTATIENDAKEARRVQATLTADRDRALASERRVRDQLTAITGSYRALVAAGADAAAAGHQPPADDAVGVLADVLGRADRRAGVLAAFADAAHAAGAACERNYDAARAALMDAPVLGLKARGTP